MSLGTLYQKRLKPGQIHLSKAVQLNLGCGDDIRKGFHNIDIRPIPGVDLVANACKLPIYKTESVNFIVAQHLLEYIPRKRMVMALSEWWRVLGYGGVLELRVTDIEAVTKEMYASTISGEMGLHHEMVLAFLYGKQDGEHDVCFNGFTQQFLEGVLTGLNFKIDNYIKEEYDLIVTAIK